MDDSTTVQTRLERSCPHHIQKLDEAAANKNDSAGRRQLIMHFVELGKSTEELKEILELLYGSSFSFENQNTTAGVAVERRQQILKLLGSGKSAKEVSEIVTLMYGTSDPISTTTNLEAKDAASHQRMKLIGSARERRTNVFHALVE